MYKKHYFISYYLIAYPLKQLLNVNQVQHCSSFSEHEAEVKRGER